MFREIDRVARRHWSPPWVVATFFVAAALAIVGGGWMMWTARNAGVDVGFGFGLSMLIAGIGFGGDANRRLTANRVASDLLAAAERDRVLQE